MGIFLISPYYIAGAVTFPTVAAMTQTQANYVYSYVVTKNTAIAATYLSEIDMTGATRIRAYAFSGCTKLNKIYLPDCSYVEDAAFYGCTNLQKIILPNESLVCYLSKIFTDPVTLDTTYPSNLSIYVPSTLYSSYIKNIPTGAYLSQYVSC